MATKYIYSKNSKLVSISRVMTWFLKVIHRPCCEQFSCWNYFLSGRKESSSSATVDRKRRTDRETSRNHSNHAPVHSSMSVLKFILLCYPSPSLPYFFLLLSEFKITCQMSVPCCFVQSCRWIYWGISVC